MRTIFASCLLLASLAFSSPIASPHVRVEERAAAPAAWKRSAIPPSPDYVLPLRIGLQQKNLHRLDEELLRVSDPASEHYGKHWTAEEVTEFFRPSDESITTVKQWLVDESILNTATLSASQAWLLVNVTISEAEKLFKTKYHAYEHDDGNVRVACSHYSVPQHVRHHIEIITPTLHFDVPDGVPQPHLPSHPVERRSEKQKRTGQTVAPGTGRGIGRSGHGPKTAPEGFVGALLKVLSELANCASVTTPVCLKALYNLELYTPVAASKNSFGIVEYSPNTYIPGDLDLFFNNFSQSQVGQRPEALFLDNASFDYSASNTNFEGNSESNLDLQYALVLTKGQPITLYQTGDLIQGASFNNLLDGIDGTYCTYEGGDDLTQDGNYTASVNCGVAPRSNVISTSYNYNEGDLTLFYETRQCNEYAKLGLLGTTFIFSSGDYGVASNADTCLDPATGKLSSTGTQFVPSFPSTCPYVTSVGATQIPTGGSLLTPEVACESVIYSGGGFSNNFGLPEWQAGAVLSYFQNHSPPYTAAQYNNSQTSRGYPDVSANGANYYVYVDGEGGLIYGTSAAAPVVASILTLINDARLAIGKSTIGFINPTIYSAGFAGAFNDITSGGNQGCGTGGFSAVPGWDPVTGLGTPNFAVLLAKWLLL